MTGWITNNKKMATVLRAIDRAYEAKLKSCADWPFNEKLSYVRKARAARQEAYNRVLEQASGTVTFND